MNESEIHRPRVAVIGGGIAGPAAAHRVVELAPQAAVTLFEAGPRLGGSLFTERRDGFLIEHGADSFITNLPFAVDLCRRVGLSDELIPTSAAGRRAFVVRRGRLQAVPEGFALMAPARIWPVIKTPILSPLGKMRLAWEYFVPRRAADNGDESLGSFVRRRLGREVFDRLVQPLVAGIYTADPERLSLAATLPRFIEMERKHGSLIRGALSERSSNDAGAAQASGARYSLFMTPRDGLSSLVAAVAARLPAGTVRLNTRVTQLERCDTTWRVTTAADPNVLDFDAVVLAIPASAAARLLNDIDVPLSAELSAIPYASTAVVSLAYDRRQIAHPLDGFGFVVPAIEGRRILSASFSSQKFPGRAPAEKVLLRIFIGGACQPEYLERSDEELQQLAAEEIAELLGASGQPRFATVARWPQSMPQYHLGHLDRVAKIESRLSETPNLALAGNAFRGVGIPQVVQSGEAAAERIVEGLNSRREPLAPPSARA
jgi:oxygen-dependent protoporphyrinogen oxidase